MAKRSYKQNCALALAADVIGERWSLLLVRDLLVGPRRFRDLLQSLHGIGTNLLTSRLRELESEDILIRRPLESGGHAYALTEKGHALQPALAALIRWGLLYGPANQEGFRHENEWDLVALQALFQSELAVGLSVSIQYNSEDLQAWMTIARQQVSTGLGTIDAPDLVIEGTVKDLFVDSDSPGKLCSAGSTRKLERYMAAFPLPVTP